jgi:hypothetical protein
MLHVDVDVHVHPVVDDHVHPLDSRLRSVRISNRSSGGQDEYLSRKLKEMIQ